MGELLLFVVLTITSISLFFRFIKGKNGETPIAPKPLTKKKPVKKVEKPVKKAKKPSTKKTPTEKSSNTVSYFPYTPEQKKVLLNIYANASKQQRNSIIMFFFYIIYDISPADNDFAKIERCCDLFNVKLEVAVSKYSGFGGIVTDLNPLPKSIKEFLVIESMEYMFINDKFSPERMQHAAKVFDGIGISEDKALEILAKHKAIKDKF
jgi:hypothetical protein